MRYQALDEGAIEPSGLFDESDKSILQFPQLHRPFLAVLILEVGEVFSVLLDNPVVLEPHPAFDIFLPREAEILKDDRLVCLLQPSRSRASAPSTNMGEVRKLTA